MEKADIEFYNGLIKGVVKGSDIVENSTTLEEAKEKMGELLGKARAKVILMVDSALD